MSTYILFAFIITIAAAIPYKAFTNWRKGEIQRNIQTLAMELGLNTNESEESGKPPFLSGRVDNLWVTIDSTITSEGVKFPVTHISTSLLPVHPEEKDEIPTIRILPNRSFMTTPEEQYLKTENVNVDRFYLIAMPAGKETHSVSENLATILEKGIDCRFFEGQLLLWEKALKYSIADHLSSKDKLETVRFLMKNSEPLINTTLSIKSPA